MRIRIGPGRRMFSLIVVAILAMTLIQGGTAVQSAPVPRANSQCDVPTPTTFASSGIVQIDVKPGNPLNPVNTASEGVISIAICSDDADGVPPQATGEFNAPAQVHVKCNPTGPDPTSPSCRDFTPPSIPTNPLPPSSPTAGVTGFEQSLHSCNGDRDINGDGAKDLVCHFYVNRMDLTPTSDFIILRGCCDTPEFGGANAINCETECDKSFPFIPDDCEEC